MSFFKNKVDKSLLKEIAKRFFIGNPIKISQKRQGQTLNQNNCFVLGTWAGPEATIGNLFHEMGHLAEREVRQLKKRPIDGWGFKFGKPMSLAHHSWCEPQTDQQVMREARVWSFQLSLSREFGLKETALELCESAIYLPAFCHFQFKFRDKHAHLGYSEKEAAAVEELANIVEDGAKIYTYDKFVKDWNHRMGKLK